MYVNSLAATVHARTTTTLPLSLSKLASPLHVRDMRVFNGIQEVCGPRRAKVALFQSITKLQVRDAL